MFPLRWNFPFRKKDGSLSTIQDEIDNGGGGGEPYVLPTASPTTKGGIKVGEGLTMDGEVLKNTNPTPYSLPTASNEILGGVKVGSGLSIEDGVLSASGGGGAGGHCFAVITNVPEFNELIVFTSNNTITDAASLYAALEPSKGRGIVISSGENTNHHTTACWHGTGQQMGILEEAFTISDDAVKINTSVKWVASAITVTSVTKIF